MPDFGKIALDLASKIETRFKYKNNNQRTALITIIDDDGYSEFLTKLKPVFDTKGVKCSIAINPGYVGATGRMTWAEIEQLHTEGFEILNHGWTHQDPATLTLAELETNYALEKAAFIEHGLDKYDYFVYPGTQDVNDAELKNKLKSVYKCCFANTDTGQYSLPFDPYTISRVASYGGSLTTDFIDNCFENSGYCVLFGHSQTAEYTAELLGDTIDYITSKGLTYTTASDAVNDFENIVELGNSGGDYFYLDKNGNVNFSIFNLPFPENFKRLVEKPAAEIKTIGFANDLISSYKENCITYELIQYSTALALGLPEAGLIETIRFPAIAITQDNEWLSYQRYIRLNKNESWLRHWNYNNSSWDEFMPIHGATVTSTTRLRYVVVGTPLYDITLNKPIWCKTAGWWATKAINRSTSYVIGDLIEKTGYIFKCIIAGTTGEVEPTWEYGSGKTVIDGTVTWGYMGAKAVYVDATGTTV